MADVVVLPAQPKGKALAQTGEVVQFKRPRKTTIKGSARELHSDAIKAVGKPVAVVIVALGADGRYALRHVGYADDIKPFDALSRAGCVIDRARNEYLEEE